MAQKPLGVAGAAALIRRQLGAHVQVRADQARDIVSELHRSAPRGGSYLNAYRQPRSAPGEQPAEEHGNLKARLEMPPQPIDGGFAVMVNYSALEFGSTHVQPRPMGRMTVTRLKEEVKSGS